MSGAVADHVVPRRLVVGAQRRRVAVVAPDAGDREVFHRLSADAVFGGAALARAEDVAHQRPDAVILIADLSAPSGLAPLRRIRKDAPRVPVVVVARNDGSPIAAREALNAGAEAYVRADEIEQAIAPALDAVMAGFVCVPRDVRRLVAKPTFSHREKEVLALLITGLTNAQIAARLYLAESTVKSHVASAFAKLGVRSRKDAATLLLDPGEGLAAIALPPQASAMDAR
jgi:DNA-binding NarL/FixJ family response regulator